MARKAKIAKNAQRKQLVEKYADRRRELKAVLKSPHSTVEEREAAMLALQKLPRNSSSTRVRNRCSMTGRPRAYLRKFGLSRIAFREMALEGEIPGVRKASW